MEKEKKMEGYMRKGVFWAIPDDDGKPYILKLSAVCDSNGKITEESPAYNSKKGDSYSHEQSWSSVTESSSKKIRDKPWNHFPRGRVEIKNGKAIVYHNPKFENWIHFEETIINEFELSNIPVRFIPDHSKHYESGTQ